MVTTFIRIDGQNYYEGIIKFSVEIPNFYFVAIEILSPKDILGNEKK